MISAGQDTKTLSPQQLKTPKVFCGQDYAEDTQYYKGVQADQQCHDKVTGYVEDGFSTPSPMTDLQSWAFDQYLLVIRGTASVQCLIKEGLNPKSFGKNAKQRGANANKLISCTAEFGNGAKTLKFNGQDMMIDEAIALAAEKARLAGNSWTTFPKPANLIQFENDYADVGDGFFGKEATRLWREALNRTPESEWMDASPKLAEQVIDKVKPLAEAYKKAQDDAAKEGIEEGVRRIFVGSVHEKPDYNIDWGLFNPEIIEKIFPGQEVPKGMQNHLKRLYAEAADKYYKNGGDPTKEESELQPLFIEEVKAEGLTDPDDVETVSKMEVKEVEVSGGSPTKVDIGPRKTAAVPPELENLAQTQEEKRAVRDLWNDVVDVAKNESGLTMTVGLESKMVDSLKKPADDGGIGDLFGTPSGAVEIASKHVVGVTTDGEVLLETPNIQLFGTWKEPSGEVSSTGTYALGQLGAPRTLVRIYHEALEDFTPEEAANAIDNWVNKIEQEEGDSQPTLYRITGAVYGGKNPDGTINMVEKTGDVTVVTVIGGNGPSADIAEGVTFHGGVDLTAGVVNTPDGAGGMYGVDGGFGIDWDPDGPFELGSMFRVRWYGSDATYNIPGAHAAVLTPTSDGSYDIRGLHLAYVAPALKFPLSFGSLKLSLPLGIINGNPKDYGGFSPLEDIANGLPPFNVASRDLGAMLEGTLAGNLAAPKFPNPMKKAPDAKDKDGDGDTTELVSTDERPDWSVTTGVNIGSAGVSVSKRDETYLAGFAARPHLGAAINACSLGGASADCKLELGWSGGFASGDKEKGDKAFDKNVNFIGLNFNIQFHPNVILDLGGRYGWLRQDNKPKEMDAWALHLGGHFPIFVNDKVGMFTPYLMGSFGFNKGPFQVADFNDPDDPGEVPYNPECDLDGDGQNDPGIECPTTEDPVTVEGPDDTALAGRENIFLGEKVFNIGLGVTWDIREWAALTLGMALMPHSDHESDDWGLGAAGFINLKIEN